MHSFLIKGHSKSSIRVVFLNEDGLVARKTLLKCGYADEKNDIVRALVSRTLHKIRD